MAMSAGVWLVLFRLGNERESGDTVVEVAMDRETSTTLSMVKKKGAEPIEPGTAKEQPILDRWAGGKVVSSQSFDRSADGTRYRLKRIIRHPSIRYPVLVEEAIHRSSHNGVMTGREVLSERAASHILVTPRRGVSEVALSDLVSGMGFVLRERVSSDGPFRVEVPVSKLAVDSVSALVADFNSDAYSDVVAYADYDFVRRVAAVPNDAFYTSGDQWSLRNDGSRSGSVEGVDIGALSGWEVRTDAASIVVAVIDTGVRYTHEDLKENIWVNDGEVEGNEIDDDGNGYVDDWHGINTLFSSQLSVGGDPMDDHGHGTHVAGIIGAEGNNDVGITGVAWSVQLMPLKFLGAEGNGLDSDAIKCIDYAIQNGAHIINNSWGGAGVNKALTDAVERAHQAGVLFVVAAGNGGDDIDVDAFTPAGIDLPNVVTVANHDDAGEILSSSNFGREKVDIIGPGTRIRSTTFRTDSSYGFKTGTSMAAPHVSGVLALLKAEYPGESHIKLKERVLQGAVRDDRYTEVIRTASRLNLARALAVRDFIPPSPSNSFVTSRGGSALLTWEHIWDEPIDGFRIEKRIGESDWERVGFAGPEATAFADPNPLSFTANVAYRVVSVNEFGESLTSHNRILNTIAEESNIVDIELPEGDEGIGYGFDIDATQSVLVSGAPFDDDAGEESGSVYVYERIDGSGWQYRQKLIGDDVSPYDSFGHSVSLSGTTLAAGAHLEDGSSIDTGAVYLFEQGENGSWYQMQKINAVDGEPQDKFGFNVDVFRDVLVASARDDDDSGQNAGSVYVYERNAAGDWVFQTKLVPPPESKGQYFGWSVSTYEGRIVIGAKGDNSDGTGVGSVYVYRKSGAAWQLEQKLLPEDASAYDAFGTSVDFDGTTIAVGTPNDDGAELDSGSVSLYRIAGTQWERFKVLAPSHPIAGLRIGVDVAVSGGRVATVGRGDDGSATGGFLFEEDASGEWMENDANLGLDSDILRGGSVALASGVMSIGMEDERRLRSVYDIVAAPYELAIDSVSSRGVELSWSISDSRRVAAVIERREAGDSSWSQLATVEAGSSSYLDSTAVGKRSWEYRARSVSGGLSGPSNAVSTPLLPSGRLVNLSVRGFVGKGERVLVPGFTLVGEDALSVAIRARGPSLFEHGVPNPIIDPKMKVFPLGQDSIGENGDWFDDYSLNQMEELERETGASPIGLYASESVYLADLSTGVYTAVIEDAGGSGEVGLAEVFEVPQAGEYNSEAALVNLSARGFVDGGTNVLIGGFVVAGEAPVGLLVRGVGPGLRDYGVVDVLEIPRVTLYDVDGMPIASNANWGLGGQIAQIVDASESVGAFDLTMGSADSALLVTLPPGLYTCVLDAASAGNNGVGLLEIYLTP